MENVINLSVTPVQVLLALAFQVWLIVFPIILLRKVDRLTNMLEERLDNGQASGEEGA